MKFRVEGEEFVENGVLGSEGVQKFKEVMSSSGHGSAQFRNIDVWRGVGVGSSETEKWERKRCLRISPAATVSAYQTKRHLLRLLYLTGRRRVVHIHGHCSWSGQRKLDNVSRFKTASIYLSIPYGYGAQTR